MHNRKILGLDLGSNSIGWALLEETDGKLTKIIDLGCRIFIKAVEGEPPTPKNLKRRHARLTRRILQRRARRKQRMANYLIKCNLLPIELVDSHSPEMILNNLGNPYQLRAKALDYPLTPHELGRVLLHLVQRRGFLSNRKSLLGDMVDDPDVLAMLNVLEEVDDSSSERAKEETAFKKDICELRVAIAEAGCRSLGEYLSHFEHHDCKRNRLRDGGHLRTDRKMYRDELELIWHQQKEHHPSLTTEIIESIEHIIFYQRPLKLRSDRIGKCSLEPKRQRANIARLQSQKFRYLQDINNLQYFESQSQQWLKLTKTDKEKLIDLFENEASITFPKIRKTLGFDKTAEFNLERGNKKLKGNITSCEIRKFLPEWDGFNQDKQQDLVEDLLTIQKKSVLKKRLCTHWGFESETAVNLCLLEFEPGHSNLSAKAIAKLLPFLQQGLIYSDARVSAGYGYEVEHIEAKDKLGRPPEITNPIVSKALHELRRLVNALIAEYGKPDAIHIEMARDLEMNTKRYAEYEKRQKYNTKANEEAVEKFQEMSRQNPHLQLSSYPGKTDKIKYRLWKDQNRYCAYSGRSINLSTLFGAEIEIDHILPYSESLDDSYMNKVICYTQENRKKAQQSPIDAFGKNAEQWNQIVQAINRWDKGLIAKKNRFFMTAAEVQQRDFISSQLNDTRYICREANDYIKQLGVDVSVSKGITTAWVRHQWGLNTLLGDTAEKDRTDHRHHAIDAMVIACIDRRFYKNLVSLAKELERKQSQLNMRDIHIDTSWTSLREDMRQALDKMIVAHVPQLKLSGELHELTGAGFITGLGNVYRKNLDGNFTQVDKIIDPTVKLLVKRHLNRHDDKPKIAFAPGNVVLHKDGKTPIKRVRILQSKTTLDKLQKTKFGARNKQGVVFKWLPYGNLHHVEILRNKASSQYSGHFVTMMEASKRAKGIDQDKQSIVNSDHSGSLEFVMALHINDLVSVDTPEGRAIYRIQALDSPNKRLKLRLHTAAVLSKEAESLPDRSSTIPALMEANLEIIKVNAIGKRIP